MSRYSYLQNIKEKMKKLYDALINRKFNYKFLRLSNLLKFDYKEEFLLKAFEYVQFNRISGGYFEFGVYRGASLIISYKFDKMLKTGLYFYCFDSFKGLPEIKGIDRNGNMRKGDVRCSRNEFIRNLVNNGIDMSIVRIYEGYFEDVLRRTQINDKVAIAFLDCDLYYSTKQALDFITDKLQNGSLIVFDDWNLFKGSKEKGQKKAFEEWKTKNKIKTSKFLNYGWHGNSFIIHKPV